MPTLSTLQKKRLVLAIGHAVLAPTAFGATIEVDSSGDIGSDCTLRNAVAIVNAQANPADNCTVNGVLGVDDTITFGVDAVTDIISDIVIENDVLINPGGQEVTISGAGASRLFHIISSSVTIDNLVMAGGVSKADGGALRIVDSTVTLTDSTISDNWAGDEGGGINVVAGSSVTLVNSTVSNNSTNADGGGINAFAGSSVTLVSSTISGNLAAGVGGGVSSKGSNLALNDAIISGNSASFGGGVFCNDEVGDIYSSLTNTILTGNSASSSGGGVYVGGFANLNVEGTTLSSNLASSDGGGMAVFGQGALQLYNSTASGNSANYSGGALFVVEGASARLLNSTVYGNSAELQGGGLFSDTTHDHLRITNSIVSGNNTQGDGQEIFNLGGFLSGGHNLIGHNQFSTSEAVYGAGLTGSDIVATNDLPTPTILSSILEPLASNGGVTQTHALVEGSPAINAGLQLICDAYPMLVNDQRGKQRNDGQCDIGSYEVVDEDSCFVIKAQNGNVAVFCL